MSRQRIDSLLAERGLVASRTAAAESVRAGGVQIGRDGPLALRPSQLVADEDELIVTQRRRFVSRGGIKLENALNALALDVGGLSCLDVGASTGGFTDCLLQRGAERVIALDVAYGQLDLSLREDRRVSVIERCNARDLSPEDLPYLPDLAILDVSFISLAKLLPALKACVSPEGEMLAMVKPQFELGRARVGRGGVVRSIADRRDAIRAVAGAARSAGLTVSGLASSGLPGPKGNIETFLRCGSGSGEGEPFDIEAALGEEDV